MDKETALRKIEKCLKLSKSSEPHEAARAMRQAQALMRQFDIEHPELLAMGVTQEWSKSKVIHKPPQYEVSLARMVADAFGCSFLFNQKWLDHKLTGGYLFIGASTSSMVASYTFTVLARKLAKARTLYSKESLKRYRKNKAVAADVFCDGWVRAVAMGVQRAENSPDRAASISAYIGLNFSDIKTLNTKKRELANEDKNHEHLRNGWKEGQKVQVLDGISSEENVVKKISFLV